MKSMYGKLTVAAMLILFPCLFAAAEKPLGISPGRPICNTTSCVVLNESVDGIELTGIADETITANKYLGAELLLDPPQDLTGKTVSFEFKGDPGDLYIDLFNREDPETPCMAFAGYERIDASDWNQTKLKVGSATGGFRWKNEWVNGAAPENVDRMYIKYRSKKQNEPVRLEIRNLKLETPYVPEFKRIIAPELTLEDIQPEANVTTLIKNGEPVASVIVPANRDITADEKQALDLLEKTYGVQFPLYKLKEGQLELPDGNYILFGDGVKGLVVNRLLSRFSIDPEPGFYEVRNIRNAFQADCNILYFGGLPESRILGGAQRFIARQPKTGDDLLIGKYIDSEKYSSEPPVDPDQEAAKALQDIQAVYESEGDTKNQEAIRVVSRFARLYNSTSDDRLVAPFMELIHVMIENYESAKNWRKTPPSFRAHELAFSVDLMDESDSFTDDDLLQCGNLMRQIAEDCMNYYEMRDPMRLYDSGTVEYLTNHPLHASRSVSAVSRFLKKRFHIPAADYWMAVSEYAFKATDEAEQGPEDSGHYQWGCRRLYNEVALQSGALPLLTPNLKTCIDFAIAHFNQMGNGASYGDSIPMETWSPVHLLIDGYRFYGDDLSGHILTFPPDSIYVNDIVRKLGMPEHVDYQPRMTGLTVFPLCDFLKKYHKVRTDDELLNKAVFRSGYEPSDEYMMLGGINLANLHGNTDANGIIEYSRGDRYWLVDGHYIKKYPQDQNTLIVSRDATVQDQRVHSDAPPVTEDQFARVDGIAAAPDGSMGITATTLCNYGGTDWTRNIFWSSLNGFWVIDQLNVKESGRYVVKCIWRTLGDVTVTGDTVTVAQKKTPESSSPDRLVIARGDSAVTTVSEQFDVGHNGPFGYYDKYSFAGPEVKVISEINNLDLKKGVQIDYANFFKTGFGDDMQPPQIRKAGNSAWIADCRQLVVLKTFQSSELNLKADRALITPEGILAIGATKLQVGDQAVDLPNEKTFFCKFGEGVLAAIAPEKVGQVLDGIYAGAKPVALQELQQVSALELPVKNRFETTEPITAMATSDDRIVCGFEDGRVVGYNLQGQQLWQSNVNAPVRALCPVSDGSQTLWGVGTRYDNRENQTGTVGLISDEGKLLWQKPVVSHGSYGAVRPGTVCTVIAAKLLPGEGQQLIAGSEALKYLAFDLTGRQLWKFSLVDSATVCAVADMTGDGLDEIAFGNKSWWHWIAGPDGKELKRMSSGDGDSSVAMVDVTGDGLSEAVFGREDNYIKAMSPGGEGGYLWQANVGGEPTGIVKAPNGGLAVSTTGDAVVFVNNSGEKTNVVYFPEALSGIKNINGSLYTVCRDGFVYQLTGNKITGKVKIPAYKAGVLPPMLNAAGTHPVVGFGRTVFILE